MPRKKIGGKKAAMEQTENTATAVMEGPTQEAEPASPPAWIDGPPVDENGKIIRGGFEPPARQMELSGSAQTNAAEQPEPSADSAAPAHGKNWGDPYKSIFSSPEMGFELGENRRFKQRVFRFAEKPSAEILATLKEIGFTYRAGEKAWTINATPESRKLTDDLARTWAGPNYSQSAER
jgi:hypothetical protein